MRTQRPNLKAIAMVLTVVWLFGSCGDSGGGSTSVVANSVPAPVASAVPSATTTPAPAAAAQATSARRTAPLKALSKLRVKGRAPKTGYSRSKFGSAWYDVDRNGCDTRNDILARDFVNPVFSGSCKVVGGTWTDPYSGVTYQFDHRPSELDGDHVVSLSDAWQKGAQGWRASKRIAFANDPLNVVMTVATLNRQKSDSDAASWLPPDKSYRCAFIARQVAVKRKYGLWVTRAEYSTMRRILRSQACARTRLPRPSDRPR